METKNPRGFQMLSSESSGDVMVETDSFLKQSMIYCNVNFLLDHCRNYSLWWGSILLLFPDTAAQSLFFVNTLHIFFNRWAEKKICILCLLSTLFKDQEEDNRKWSFRKMPNITVKQIRWLLRNKCKPCLLFWRLAHCPHTTAPPYCRYTTMISITMTKNVRTWGCPTHLNTHTQLYNLCNFPQLFITLSLVTVRIPEKRIQMESPDAGRVNFQMKTNGKVIFYTHWDFWYWLLSVMLGSSGQTLKIPDFFHIFRCSQQFFLVHCYCYILTMWPLKMSVRLWINETPNNFFFFF